LSDQDYKLRESISELAAEMVIKTAAQEGEASPIPALLQEKAEPSAPFPSGKKRKSKSLAKRIKDKSV
jgi:hypothetical protein